MDEDIDVKSEFNSVIKKEMKEINFVKPRRSILKNKNEGQNYSSRANNQPELDPRARRNQRLRE